MQDEHRLYANAMPFYIKDLRIHRFWYSQGLLELVHHRFLGNFNFCFIIKDTKSDGAILRAAKSGRVLGAELPGTQCSFFKIHQYVHQSEISFSLIIGNFNLSFNSQIGLITSLVLWVNSIYISLLLSLVGRRGFKSTNHIIGFSSNQPLSWSHSASLPTAHS
jgi:hypothetical protein